MSLPTDYLLPLWRGVPNGTGVGTVAVDPREAEFVLAHGLKIDGDHWRVVRGGFPALPGGDGRVTLRVARDVVLADTGVHNA